MALDEATRILAIRHGETDWNTANRIQGHTDIPLNATGRWQAERLVDAVREEGIAAIYSSDLARAWDTALAVARGSGVAPRAERRLRERHVGAFEGCTWEEIAQRWPELNERWRLRDPGFGPAGGEVLRDFHARCVDTATALAAAHPGETIALVAHGGVIDCLYRAAAGLPVEAPRTWRLGNAGINRLLWTPQGFVLVGWADTSHLEVAA
jgi:probable phosphoglycerate mutase